MTKKSNIINGIYPGDLYFLLKDEIERPMAEGGDDDSEEYEPYERPGEPRTANAMIDVRRLKELMKKRLPPTSPLRMSILDAADEVPYEEYVVMAEMWLKMLDSR